MLKFTIVSFQLMFSLLLFLIFFFLNKSSWLAGSHFIHTPGRYETTFIQGGSALMSNPQPFHINLLFILYHITIFLFYFIIYNRKGNPSTHLLLKIAPLSLT